MSFFPKLTVQKSPRQLQDSGYVCLLHLALPLVIQNVCSRTGAFSWPTYALANPLFQKNFQSQRFLFDKPNGERYVKRSKGMDDIKQNVFIATESKALGSQRREKQHPAHSMKWLWTRQCSWLETISCSIMFGVLILQYLFSFLVRKMLQKIYKIHKSIQYKIALSHQTSYQHFEVFISVFSCISL